MKTSWIFCLFVANSSAALSLINSNLKILSHTPPHPLAHPRTHRHNAHTHTCVLVHLLRTTVVREYLQPLTQGQILSFNQTVRCSALTTCDFKSKACLTVGISPTLHSHYTLCRSMAMPWPPPMQALPMAHLTLRLFISCTRWAAMREPEAPVWQRTAHTQSQHTPG